MPGFGVKDFDQKQNLDYLKEEAKKPKQKKILRVLPKNSKDEDGPRATSSPKGSDSEAEFVPYVYRGVGADSDRVTFAILARSIFEFSASKDPSVEKGRIVKNDQLVEILVVTDTFVVGCTCETGQTILFTNEVGHGLKHRHFTVCPQNFETVMHVGDIVKIPTVRCINRRIAFADTIDHSAEVKPEEAIGFGVISGVNCVDDRTTVRIRLEVNDRERKRQHFETRAFGWLKEEVLHRTVMVRFLPDPSRVTQEHGVYGVSLLTPVEEGVTCKVPSPDHKPWRGIAYAIEDDGAEIEIPKSVIRKFTVPFKLFPTEDFTRVFQGWTLLVDVCPNQPRNRLGDSLRPARRAFRLLDYITPNSVGPPNNYVDPHDSTDEGDDATNTEPEIEIEV